MKKTIIPTVVLIILIIATTTYSILTAEIGADTNMSLAKWNITLNGNSITRSYQNAITINDFIWNSNNTNNNTVAPGSTGTFTMVMNPINTDVAIRYDIIFSDHTMNANKLLTVTSVTVNDNSLIQTAPNNYSGIFTLAEINARTTKSITIGVSWINNEANNLSDSQIGMELTTADFLDLTFVASQYKGETITPYEPEITNHPELIDSMIENGNNTLCQDIADPTEYYYCGDASDNYLWYGGHEWRIIGFNTTSDTIKLMTLQPITSLYWGDYDCLDNETCTSLETSYVGTWLGEGTDGVFLKSLQGTNLYTKITSTNYTRNIYDGTEFVPATTSAKVRLLTQSEYDKAGGDNSFLNTPLYFMADANDDYMSHGVHPLITVSNVEIDENTNGTKLNPFVIVTDEVSTTIAGVKVGDYIEVPCLGASCPNDGNWMVRVISKDADTAKVAVNGLLATTSLFEEDPDVLEPYIFTSTSTINQPLTTFLGTISSNIAYKTGTAKSFNIGIVGDGYSYTETANMQYDGYVGLPVLGEMFSGNDLELYASPRKFTNINTIENPNASVLQWYMTPYDDEFSMYGIGGDGVFSTLSPDGWDFGVRPTFFLKNTVNIVSGTGSPLDPYQLN